MNPVYLMSFVEDEPTRHIVRRIFDYVKANVDRQVEMLEGYPQVLGGCSKLKARAMKWAEAASHGTWLLVVTDLDAAVSPNEIGKQWLGVDCLGQLPERFIFRIAVREIESWIMADNLGLAEYLHVPSGNITIVPDTLRDPKQELLRIIREKCKMKKFKNMLPIGNQHVGIDYNRHLCEFVDLKWNLDLARQHSPSLDRSVARMIATLSSVN